MSFHFLYIILLGYTTVGDLTTCYRKAGNIWQCTFIMERSKQSELKVLVTENLQRAPRKHQSGWYVNVVKKVKSYYSRIQSPY